MYRRSLTWISWRAMIVRCSNPRHKGWPRYGGRGIRVCARWLDFGNFLADMGPRLSAEQSIDRVDGDGDYEPNNCRWATRREQGANRRDNVRVSYDGRTQTVTEWARELGVPGHRIANRLRRGWPIDQALTRPPNRQHRTIAA